MQTLGIKATRTTQNKAVKIRIMKQMNKCDYVYNISAKRFVQQCMCVAEYTVLEKVRLLFAKQLK